MPDPQPTLSRSCSLGFLGAVMAGQVPGAFSHSLAPSRRAPDGVHSQQLQEHHAWGPFLWQL